MSASGEKKQWADGPFQLISGAEYGIKAGEKITGTKAMVVEMILIHNFMLRGINGIYNQASNVQNSPADVEDFVNYSIVWAHVLDEHHTAEEEIVFPGIENAAGVPGLMNANVEQHKAFHTGLEVYEGYLEKVKAGDETFDAQKLKDIINSFMPILRQHLADEIATLKGLSAYEDKVDWAKWWQDTIKLVVKKTENEKSKTEIIPWCVYNHDKTYEGGVFAHWPPLPWIVMFILQWFMFSKHKSWWRFACCDYNGTPKELPFA